jgi:hypothetical protein
MNQGQFEALLAELKQTNALLAELVQTLGADSFLPNDPPARSTYVTQVPVISDSGGRTHLPPPATPEPPASGTARPRKGRK